MLCSTVLSPLTRTATPVVLEGAVTAFVGIAVYWVLPSYPSKCKFFDEEQRRLSIWRTTQDAMGEADEGETSLKKGAKLVFKDWKVSTYVLLTATG
jgi:hypothetical protein